MKLNYIDKPTSSDILYRSNGRKEVKQHPGNIRFRRILDGRLLEFEKADPSKQRKIAYTLYYELLMVEHPAIRFLRRDTTGEKFFLLRQSEAIENIRLALVGMMDEKAQQKTNSKKFGLNNCRIAKGGKILGEIDPNRIVDLTNDDSDNEQNKKELYSPPVNLSRSNLNGESVPPADAPKSLEFFLYPQKDPSGISRTYIHAEDIKQSDILYFDREHAEVEIANDEFQRILMAKFEDYQKNREGIFSREQFQTRSLRDLKEQDPSVRFLRYDWNVEEYYHWDSSEALDMIRQAMEERLNESAHQKPKSDADSDSVATTTASILKDPSILRHKKPTEYDARKLPSNETQRAVDSFKDNTISSPFKPSPQQESSKDPSKRVLSVQQVAKSPPEKQQTSNAASPPLKSTASNGSREHKDSSHSKTAVTPIDSPQQSNGRVLKPVATSPTSHPPTEEDILLPLNPTSKAGSGGRLGSMATAEVSMTKETSSYPLEEGIALHEHDGSPGTPPPPREECCGQSDDECADGANAQGTWI